MHAIRSQHRFCASLRKLAEIFTDFVLEILELLLSMADLCNLKKICGQICFYSGHIQGLIKTIRNDGRLVLCKETLVQKRTFPSSSGFKTLFVTV